MKMKEDKIMRKGILTGIGILIILLALAGIGSAYPNGGLGWGCTTCHSSITPSMATFYNQTHRYNDTVINPLYCDTCHVDVSKKVSLPNPMNFSLRTGTPTYLNSSVCEDCHKVKYDNWRNTMHRVMLTKNTSGALMNLSLPDGLNWSNTNVSYMIVGKSGFYYLNATGYLFRKYNVVTGAFSPYNTTAPETRPQYSCGGCHTTGYNATNGNQSNLSGIIGTWAEEGITCENCHGPGGNGHNVTVYTKGEDCMRCHYGAGRQGLAMTNRHATAPAEESTSSSCTFCHSPYDNYKTGKVSSLSDASNVTCSICHNPHNTTDDKYAGLLAPNGFNNISYATVEDVKLSFFNGTASNTSRNAGSNASLTAGNDIYDILMTPAYLYSGSVSSRKDSNYGNGSINVTGPVSEVLCSKCHYRHGLGHIANVNLTHGRNNVTNSSETATCIDCHMSNAGGKTEHTFDAQNATNYPKYTCSKGTNCHVTSAQNLSLSNGSIVPLQTEWDVSRHNKTQFYKNDSYFANQTGFSSSGSPGENNSDCMKCHSPFEWNPLYTIKNVSDFRGVTCAVCHNIHDMGDSINASGLKYSWYNRDAVPVLNSTTGAIERYKANYTLMANTTELCGNCHSNDNPRIYKAGPGWNGTDATSTSATVYPISSHGRPAKDLFLSSPKQSGQNFECIDCHMYTNKTNATGLMSDTDKITGHSFTVNKTGLQNTSRCRGCHDGSSYATISDRIATVQAATQAKWNTTNSTVMGALAYYKSYTGVKNLSADKIARAYWNLKLVSSDDSWGVHNPDKATTLLDEAAAYAAASNASLGHALVSTVNLTAGWNLKSLENASAVTSPVSIMSSVSSNITVVWGYNTSNPADPWELYDPAMPSSLNDLTEIVSGEGYWIYALRDCVWTV
ncbi:Cytochrome c7 c [uncultured archaeon]|nr:Cytochrome c7 c [uncultured archaeon]